MKKSLKRAVAVSAVCAAGLAGTLTTTSTATADQSADSSARAGTLTNFGMNSLAYGTKLAVGGIDVKSLKDAKIVTGCSRSLTDEIVRNSQLSTDQITALLGQSLPIDIAKLIHLNLSKSTTQNYREGDVTGVRATNTFGDIQIGGEVIEDISLPTITITGLKSIADSFYDPADSNGDGKKFGTAESFSFGGLTIDLPEDGVVGETLQTLFDIIGVKPEAVTDPVNATVNQLLQALQQITETAGLGDVIQIPGLGSLGLGSSFSKVTDSSAASGATALNIEVDPSGEDNDSVALLKLGNAQSRIAAPVQSSVFRSTIMGLDFRALPLGDVELLHMGGIGTQAIPCEGTDGQMVSKKLEGSRSIPLNIPGLGGLATLTGIEYAYKGEQLSRGRARSVAISSLGDLSIPALGLEIKGIQSRLNLKSFPGERVRGSNKPVFKVLDIVKDGESILPKNLRIGDVIEFVVDELDKTGFITFGKVHSRNYYGAKLSAIQINIPGLFDIDLGWLESQIYPK